MRRLDPHGSRRLRFGSDRLGLRFGQPLKEFELAPGFLEAALPR